MRRQVLFVSYTADWTGPTNSLLQLLKLLRSRYDVAVLTRGNGIFTEKLAAEQIPWFSFASLGKWYVPRIYRLIRREKIDVVYGNTTHGSSRNALVAAKLARVPFVCHVRAIASARPRFQHAFLNLADAVVAVSQACADSLRGRVVSSKVQIVRNGVDVNIFGRHGRRTDPEMRLAVINVGRMTPMKGQEYALQAVSEVNRRGQSVDLLLVGQDQDSAYAKRIAATAHEFGLDRQVAFVGFSEDIPQLHAEADVYIHTSLEEAHPRAVLEAMAAGLPVVAFDVGGVSETVEHGKTGILVPVGDSSALADAILRLAENRSLREDMGKLGRLRVESHFDQQATADKVADVIDGVVGRPTLADIAVS